MTLVLLLESARTASLFLLTTFARASLEAALVGGLVWAVCRALPALPPAVRTWLWWLVSLELLIGLTPLPGMPLAWVPSPAAQLVFVEQAPTGGFATEPTLTPTASAADDTVVPRLRHNPSSAIAIPYRSLWPLAAVLAWLAVVLLQAFALTRAFGLTRRLRRHAEPAPVGVLLRVAHLVRAFALPVVPRVLVSRLSAVPLLTGFVRPAILLPAGSPGALSRTELDLVLGHELAHVRRGDLFWGWVPAIAARLFFFHPLARLACREYLSAREEACDAEVLQTLDAAPADYGRVLLKLGVATTDDVLAAAGASPTFDSLKRRLTMLDRSRTPASRWWWTLAGATAVLVPLTLVAQPIPPPPPPAPTTMPAPVARLAQGDVVPVPPPPPEAPAPPDAPPPSFTPPPAPAPPAVPPLSVVPPAPPAPPTPPDAQEPRDRSRRVETPWVLIEPGDRSFMAGDSSDRADAERHRQSPNDTLLWFRYAGTPYVTRDAATIAAVRDAFVRVNAVSEDMKRIGEKMAAQGNGQGTVGARQAELGAKQAELAAQMAKMAAERAARAAQAMTEREAASVAASAEREAAGEQRRRIAAKQYDAARLAYEKLRTEQRAREEQLDVQMKALGDQQRALGVEMRTFGKAMEVHGAQMKVMGDTLEAAVDQAMAQVTVALGSAVTSGKATRAK